LSSCGLFYEKFCNENKSNARASHTQRRELSTFPVLVARKMNFLSCVALEGSRSCPSDWQLIRGDTRNVHRCG
jgi:hypothetical protein